MKDRMNRVWGEVTGFRGQGAAWLQGLGCGAEGAGVVVWGCRGRV